MAGLPAPQFPKLPKKQGRKPKLSDRMMKRLIRKARTGEYSARKLVSVASNDFNLDIVSRTMQQIISEAPFMKYLKMVKAPRTTIDDKKDRLKFAKDHLKKDHGFWSSVIFSDEKRFCLDGPDGNAHYWADTRLKRKYFSTRTRGVLVLMV